VVEEEEGKDADVVVVVAGVVEPAVPSGKQTGDWSMCTLGGACVLNAMPRFKPSDSSTQPTGPSPKPSGLSYVLPSALAASSHSVLVVIALVPYGQLVVPR